MPILTMHRLVQMNRDTLYEQKRWLVLGCLLNFDRQYALCCPKHLERRRDKVRMDSPPLFWRDPNNLGMSRLDCWEVQVFEETKYESFVSANRHHVIRDGKKAKTVRLLARAVYRSHVWWHVCKPAIRTTAALVLGAVIGVVVQTYIPIPFVGFWLFR